ncbi:hypothetical protein JMA_27040 [Jeotgalibacillus malaysiensis]|uniref:Uncharacterized protein n=1 Tax=Jeotgalibacillus malaysiensis TaxID=1508404 RepID=A0A0B5APJ8_9BACL|nr:hypothetical protein JMA_27040 [Jeotgalibacillus malaysiensis]
MPDKKIKVPIYIDCSLYSEIEIEEEKYKKMIKNQSKNNKRLKQNLKS